MTTELIQQGRHIAERILIGNDGAWPFIGGFYVAALVQAGRLEEARRQLGKLAEMNQRGINQAWKFNEWYHGQSGRPMGFAGQSWSAAMYLYAADAVQHGAPRVFEPASGRGLAPTVRR